MSYKIQDGVDFVILLGSQIFSYMYKSLVLITNPKIWPFIQKPWNTNPLVLEKDLQDDQLGLPFQANIIHHNISYNFAFGSNYLYIVLS